MSRPGTGDAEANFGKYFSRSATYRLIPTTTAAVEQWKFTDELVQFAIRQYRPIICGREVIERRSTSARRCGSTAAGLALKICTDAELN